MKINAKERKQLRLEQEQHNQNLIKMTESNTTQIVTDLSIAMKDMMNVMRSHVELSIQQLTDEMEDMLICTKKQFHTKLQMCREANKVDLESTIQLDKSISLEKQNKMEYNYKKQIYESEHNCQILVEKLNKANEAQRYSEIRWKAMEEKSSVLENQLHKIEKQLLNSQKECNEKDEIILFLQKKLTESKEKCYHEMKKKELFHQKVLSYQLSLTREKDCIQTQNKKIKCMEREIRKKETRIQDLEYKVRHIYTSQTDSKLYLDMHDENKKLNEIICSLKQKDSIKIRPIHSRSVDKPKAIESLLEIRPMPSTLATIVLPSEQLQFLESELKSLHRKMSDSEKREENLAVTIQEKDCKIRKLMVKLQSSSKKNEAYENMLHSKNIGRILAADRRFDACQDKHFSDSIKGFTFNTSTTTEGSDVVDKMNIAKCCLKKPLQCLTYDEQNSNTNVRKQQKKKSKRESNDVSIKSIIKKRQET